MKRIEWADLQAARMVVDELGERPKELAEEELMTLRSEAAAMVREMSEEICMQSSRLRAESRRLHEQTRRIRGRRSRPSDAAT